MTRVSSVRTVRSDGQTKGFASAAVDMRLHKMNVDVSRVSVCTSVVRSADISPPKVGAGEYKKVGDGRGRGAKDVPS